MYFEECSIFKCKSSIFRVKIESDFCTNMFCINLILSHEQYSEPYCRKISQSAIKIPRYQSASQFGKLIFIEPNSVIMD